MRDFSWKYFMMTGDVDAYLLYKHMKPQQGQEEVFDQAWHEDAPEWDEEL